MDSPTVNGKKSLRLRRKKEQYECVPVPEKKKHRSCSKTGCGEDKPFCCLQSSDTCTRDGYTSRWYHMSLGEHFCNDCFDNFYRPQKAGFMEFDKWYQSWYLTSKAKPSIKRFVADEVMPYWVKCSLPLCNKWREVRSKNITSDFIENFKCEHLYEHLQKNPCSVAEEGCVSDLKKVGWIEQLAEFPLLKQSPAAVYLKDFCEEGIGIYPIETPSKTTTPKWIEPFSNSLNGESPLWPHPNIMEDEEAKFMCYTLTWLPTFLSLRNLIITVWNMCPFEWFTPTKLNKFVICRGLVRIYLLSLTGNVIEYLTRKGVINYGFVSPHLDNVFLNSEKETVIIVGGGIAGLSSANHLKNLGIKSIILEASEQIGGRMSDDKSGSLGALWISGLINNPLTVLCHQAKYDMCEVPLHPVMINMEGKHLSQDVVDRMVFQFNGMMHGALESVQQMDIDSSWLTTIKDHQKDFHQFSKFSEEDDDIFDFLLTFTEIESLSNCKELTLKNYMFPKKHGNDGLVSGGFEQLVSKLSKNVDIHFNTVVKKVIYSDDTVEVVTDTESFHGSRIIIAVPLPVLQNNDIIFEPELSSKKLSAIKQLGNITQENVILQFPEKFWHTVLEGNLKFAIVDSTKPAFQYFIDVTSLMPEETPTLLSFINASNADLISIEDDKAVALSCLECLRKAFKSFHVRVPALVFSAVSHWHANKFYRSSGSFVKVGSDYSLYDDLAESVLNKLFFAGEATFRKFPNSASGAFLSGLKAAANVADATEPLKPCTFTLF